MRRIANVVIFGMMSASTALLPATAFAAPAKASNEIVDAYNRQTDYDFRRGLQMRLAWTGDFDGRMNGDIDAETLRAVRDFQARHGLAATGVINDAMLRLLVVKSDAVREPLGVSLVEDALTGVTVPVPLARVSERGESDVGTVWRSDDGRVEFETVRIADTGQTLQGLYDVLSQPTYTRKVTKASFDGLTFDLAGEADGRPYAMHFSGLDNDLRGFSVSYDRSEAPAMERFVQVASQLFDPFAGQPRAPLVAVNEAAPEAPTRPVDGRYAMAGGSDGSRSHLFELPAEVAQPGETGPDSVITPPNEFDMSGSGFVVSEDGWVLTNAHVVKSCQSILVGKDGVAKRTVFDTTNDLALVKLDTAPGKPLGISAEKPRLGEDILALGFPLRSILADSLNVTRGNVSSLLGLRNDPRYLQVSAAVQSGNSGGPLIDLSGRVVGVVTAKLNAMAVADATGDMPQSINFAIRPDVVTTFLKTNGVDYVEADASAEPDSVPNATALVKDSVVPVLCLGN